MDIGLLVGPTLMIFVTRASVMPTFPRENDEQQPYPWVGALMGSSDPAKGPHNSEAWRLLARTRPPNHRDPPRAPLAVPDDSVKLAPPDLFLRFWGVRGPIPSPGPASAASSFSITTQITMTRRSTRWWRRPGVKWPRPAQVCGWRRRASWSKSFSDPARKDWLPNEPVASSPRVAILASPTAA